MMTRMLLAVILISGKIFAQSPGLSKENAIQLALKNNATIKSEALKVEAQRQLRRSSFDLPKTDVMLMYGQYNSYATNDNNLTVSQAIPFTSFGSLGKLNRSLLTASELRMAASQHEIVYAVKQAYDELSFGYALHELLQRQDSIYDEFYKSASSRYKTGEAKYLEQITADAQRSQSKMRLNENQVRIADLRSMLRSLLHTTELPDILPGQLSEQRLDVAIADVDLKNNPSLRYMQQQVQVAEREKSYQIAKAAPDLHVGFFSQTLIGSVDPESGSIASSGQRFQGFQIGLSVPLWFVPQQARLSSAKYAVRAAQSTVESLSMNLSSEFEQAMRDYETIKATLDYYKSTALPNAELIIRQSLVAFKEGEIDYSEFLLGLRNASDIEEKYLAALLNYNQSINKIQFLYGDKN